MSPLEDAVEFYCNMLPNLEGEPNPQDDTRLYSISYFSFKGNTDVRPEMFLKFLKLNERLSDYSEDALKLFVENKIEEINCVRYILSRIPSLLV